MARQRPIKPEQPRFEPEIIPPPRGRTQAYQAGPEWFAARERGSTGGGIFVTRIGPWSSWGSCC